MKKRNSDIEFIEPKIDPYFDYSLGGFEVKYIYINSDDYLFNVKLFFGYAKIRDDEDTEAYLSDDSQYLCYDAYVPNIDGEYDYTNIRIKMEDYINYINSLD